MFGVDCCPPPARMLKIDSNDCCSCPRCPLPFWWVVVTESIGLIAWQRGEGLVQSHKVSFIITKVVEKEVGETASHAHGASKVEPERGVPAALCLLLQDDVIGVVGGAGVVGGVVVVRPGQCRVPLRGLRVDAQHHAQRYCEYIGAYWLVQAA